MSSFPRLLGASPQMPSAAGMLPEPPGEPWALAPSGSWRPHGQSQVNVGWHKRGGQEGKGSRETSVAQAADRAGFLSSCQQPPHLITPSPGCLSGLQAERPGVCSDPAVTCSPGHARDQCPGHPAPPPSLCISWPQGTGIRNQQKPNSGVQTLSALEPSNLAAGRAGW